MGLWAWVKCGGGQLLEAACAADARGRRSSSTEARTNARSRRRAAHRSEESGASPLLGKDCCVHPSPRGPRVRGGCSPAGSSIPVGSQCREGDDNTCEKGSPGPVARAKQREQERREENCGRQWEWGTARDCCAAGIRAAGLQIPSTMRCGGWCAALGLVCAACSPRPVLAPCLQRPESRRPRQRRCWR